MRLSGGSCTPPSNHLSGNLFAYFRASPECAGVFMTADVRASSKKANKKIEKEIERISVLVVFAKTIYRI